MPAARAKRTVAVGSAAASGERRKPQKRAQPSTRGRARRPSTRSLPSDQGEDGLDEMSDEESVGFEETRRALKELQSAMQRTEKKDNWAAEFEKTVLEEEKRLLSLLEKEEKERETEAKEFRTQFTALLAAALTPTGIKASTSTDSAEEKKLPFGDPSPNKHDMYLKTRALVNSTKSLVKEYENLLEYTQGLQEPPDLSEVWERDHAEARRIIAVGREASEAEITRLLAYRKGDEKLKGNERKRKRAFEKDEHLQTMLKMGRATTDDEGEEKEEKAPYGWGRLAYNVEKGMRALVKALPENVGN